MIEDLLGRLVRRHKVDATSKELHGPRWPVVDWKSNQSPGSEQLCSCVRRDRWWRAQLLLAPAAPFCAHGKAPFTEHWRAGLTNRFSATCTSSAAFGADRWQ